MSDFGAFQQLVAAGKIERIEQRGAAAGTQFVHSMCQLFGVVGEILRDFRSHVEAHHKRLIVVGTNRLVQKLNGGFLFELEPVAHGIAGVDEQADLQRQVGFGVEAADGLGRLVVVDHVEIALLQVGDAAAVLVGHGEDDVDFVGLRLDGGESLVVGRRRMG